MSDFSDEEIYQEVGNIVSQFNNLECDTCAKAVMKWLEENGIDGRIIKIKTRYGEDFILSTRLEQQGITDSITINGVHYGVEVKGRVFDNLSTEGLSRQDWISDFECMGEEFLIEELDQL